MSDRKTTLIWSLRDDVSASAKKLQNNLDQVGVKSKGATGALGKLSVATGGLVTPTSMAAAGALAFVGVINNATQAAIAEEKNIAHLSQALKANIPFWHGNTDAIEKTIAKRERLAFADDELRDSLASLVGATHDVNKAFALQKTAMDLARFKGISLQEASEALIKVEGGQYRVLKSLIGSTKDITNETEALAAIQKVAAGQADAYAKTLGGKLEAAEIRWNDRLEDIGGRTLPLMSAALGTAITALDFLSGKEVEAGAEAEAARDDLTGFMDAVGTLVPALGLASAALKDMPLKYVGSSTEDLSGKLKDDLVPALATVASGARLTKRPISQLIDKLDDMRDSAKTAFDKLTEAVYGPAILQGKEAGILQDIAATKTELTEAKRAGDKLEVRRLQGELAGLQADLKTTQAEMLALGVKPTRDTVTPWVQVLTHRTDTLGSEAREAYRWLAAINGLPSVAQNGGHSQGPSTNRPLASGGPLMPGVTRVGENAPEYLIQGIGGNARVSHSTPAGRGNMGGSGSGGVTVTIANVSETHLYDMIDRQDYLRMQRAAPTSLRT